MNAPLKAVYDFHSLGRTVTHRRVSIDFLTNFCDRLLISGRIRLLETNSFRPMSLSFNS